MPRLCVRQGGYPGHPKREKQRATEACTAGYEDGREKNADNFEQWKSEAAASLPRLCVRQGGYPGHPKREKQRATETCTAGYEDGREKNADNFEQ